VKIKCSKCNKVYKIPDEKLPAGKKCAVQCPACKNRIVIDLQSQPKQKQSLQTSKSVEKKKTAVSLGQKRPSGMTLKYGILRSLVDLPAMPHIVQKAQEIIANPDSNLNELSSLIEIEQAIATRVLKLANSTYYGLSGKVSSVQHASVLLGYKTLGELITVAGISGLMDKNLKGYDLSSEDLWRHSIAVAVGSRIIAGRKDPEFGNEAFFAGLVHDAGKVVLDQHVYERKDDFETFMGNGQHTFLSAEKEILGFDHSEMAFELCQKWQIPSNQSDAVKFHHCPSKSEGNELAYILHLADCIAMMNGYGAGQDSSMYQMEEGTLEFLSLQDKNLNDIQSQVLESVEKMLQEIPSG
jgi:HD-like signal output (HDOD) protein